MVTALRFFLSFYKDSFPPLTVVTSFFEHKRKKATLSQCHSHVIGSLHRVTETVARLVGDKS